MVPIGGANAMDFGRIVFLVMTTMHHVLIQEEVTMGAEHKCIGQQPMMTVVWGCKGLVGAS